MAVTDSGQSYQRGLMHTTGSMVDKHPADIFKSYSNKRRLRSLMGLFINVLTAPQLQHPFHQPCLDVAE